MAKYLIQIAGIDSYTFPELVSSLQLTQGFSRAEAERVAAWLAENGYLSIVAASAENLLQSNQPTSTGEGNANAGNRDSESGR